MKDFYRTIENERIFMNTRVNIKVFSSMDRKTIEEKIEKAFSKFDYVVEKFTRFEETSELSKLNKEKIMKVSKEMFDLIKFTIDLAKETGGSFDPTVIDLLEAYGYKKGYDFSILDDPEKLRKELEGVMKFRPSYTEIEMDEKNLIIKLAKKQKIELGAIGKGYAIDLAAKELMTLENFIINAGGDIYAHGGGKDKDYWTAGLNTINSEDKKEIIGKVRLKNESLASSGSWARKAKYFHHLIDTKKGKPVQDSLQTFVIAKTAMEADALSTVLFVKGKEGLKVLQKHNAEGLLITNDYKIYKTDKFPM